MAEFDPCPHGLQDSAQCGECAVEVVPALLGQIDALRAERDALRGLLGEAGQEMDRMMYHLADDSGPTHTYDEDDCDRTFALQARIRAALAGKGKP